MSIPEPRGDDGHRADAADTPLAVDVAAAAAFAAAGMASDNPAAAIVLAAAAPVVMHVIEQNWEHIRDRHQQAVAQVVLAASGELDQGLEEMLEGARSTDDGTALLAETLRAASQTLDDRKVAALARALAGGLADDQARVDEERLIVRALADIETPHLKLLTFMATRSLTPRPPGDTTYSWVRAYDFENDFAGPTGISKGSLGSMMQTLIGNGLIEENLTEREAESPQRSMAALDGLVVGSSSRLRPLEAAWRVTAFGHAVLLHLQSQPGAVP